MLPGAEKTIEVFLQSGILGALIVILLGAVYGLFKAYSASFEKRLADAIEWKRSLDNNTEAIRQLTQYVNLIADIAAADRKDDRRRIKSGSPPTNV